jgi:large subunit ribosomal protein L4
MELVVHKISGEKTSKKVKLDDSIFGVEPNNQAIYLDTRLYMANQRQGTHSTKERNAITGSRRKIKRQKGTGTARAGDIKSPLFRGGGRAFGPRPRSYSFKLNKKFRELARRSALSFKAKNEGIIIIEDFKFENSKTKNYSEMISNLKLNGKRTLLVLVDKDDNISLSSRNLQKASVTKVSGLNTYEILHAHNLLIPVNSLKEIEKLFA